MPLKKTDLAWAAGIADGEGSFCCNYTTNRGSKRIEIRFTLKMTHIETVERFSNLFRTGTKFFRKGSKKENTNHQLQWTVSAQAAASVSKKLLPFLFTKKEQAKILIKLAEEMKGKKGVSLKGKREKFQKEMMTELKSLNKRGWKND